jgi:pyruvate dehydrogenase E1 component alpha subunit
MTLDREQLLTLYTNLVRARKLDETVVKGIAEGKTVSFFHSGQGEEAVGVGGCTFLRPDDYLYYQHRGHGGAHILSKGGSPSASSPSTTGKATGVRRPRRSPLRRPGARHAGPAATIGSCFPSPRLGRGGEEERAEARWWRASSAMAPPAGERCPRR